MEGRNEDPVGYYQKLREAFELMEASNLKPTIKIKEWTFAHSYRDEKVLVGRLAEDHHRSYGEHLIESHRVVTSAVDKIYKHDTHTIVETRNTQYYLVGLERPETIEEINKEKGMNLRRFEGGT